MADTYEVKTIYFENTVVRLHTPVLEPEQREKRMKAIYKAAVNLLTDIERTKR